MTVFNLNKVDYLSQPIFFGEALNTPRYDVQTIPAFETLTTRQHGYFWRPQEIELQRDRSDYKNLSAAEKHIFTANLKYQILLDGIQGRGPITALLPIISIPEFEACVQAWSFFESIHSRSYTYMIKNVYAQPGEVLDNIIDVKEIIERASTIGRYYDEFIDSLARYKLDKIDFSDEDLYYLYSELYQAIVAIYILEGVRFYASFACTFAFGESKKMEGSAKIISLIARDENLHTSMTQHLLNFCHNSPEKVVPRPDVLKKVVENYNAKAWSMFDEAAKEEKRWADYLFKDGTMIGLNAKLLHDYIEWMVNRRMVNVGFEKLFDRSTSESANPLPWTKNWLSSKGDQVAPQETEITQYLVGAINKNVDMNDLDGFKL